MNNPVNVYFDFIGGNTIEVRLTTKYVSTEEYKKACEELLEFKKKYEAGTKYSVSLHIGETHVGGKTS